MTFQVRKLWLFKCQGQEKIFPTMTFSVVFDQMKHISNEKDVHSFVDIEVWHLIKGQVKIKVDILIV